MTLPSDITREVEAALRKAFPPERLAALVASLPQDAQERLRREFFPQPVRRTLKIRTSRRK
jgi:hypothetical protein